MTKIKNGLFVIFNIHIYIFFELVPHYKGASLVQVFPGYGVEIFPGARLSAVTFTPRHVPNLRETWGAPELLEKGGKIRASPRHPPIATTPLPRKARANLNHRPLIRIFVRREKQKGPNGARHFFWEMLATTQKIA